jgi:hypothetical protein
LFFAITSDEVISVVSPAFTVLSREDDPVGDSPSLSLLPSPSGGARERITS